jgi:hypothetical protein
MPAFVQIIEIKTSRAEEIRQLVEEMRSNQDTGTALRGTVTEDRDRPGYYLNIVEFESYESAMKNSARPAVSGYATRLAALCDEPPRFYNLNVIEAWSSEGPTPTAKTVLVGTAAAAGGIAAATLGKAKERIQERRRHQHNSRTSITPVTSDSSPADTSPKTGSQPGEARANVADDGPPSPSAV